ncbi:hypothetical protein TNCV_1375011 [Trichonephila clavipes]|nr:hypothetical protein TNCV_1375011 [Trichonephila clavipes]
MNLQKFNIRAVDSPVVRASDSRSKGLGSIPDGTQYPPSTSSLKQQVRKSNGLSQQKPRVQGAGKYISLPSGPCLNCREEIGGVAIYRVEVQPGSGNLPSFPLKRTQQRFMYILIFNYLHF